MRFLRFAWILVTLATGTGAFAAGVESHPDVARRASVELAELHHAAAGMRQSALRISDLLKPDMGGVIDSTIGHAFANLNSHLRALRAITENAQVSLAEAVRQSELASRHPPGSMPGLEARRLAAGAAGRFRKQMIDADDMMRWCRDQAQRVGPQHYRVDARSPLGQLLAEMGRAGASLSGPIDRMPRLLASAEQLHTLSSGAFTHHEARRAVVLGSRDLGMLDHAYQNAARIENDVGDELSRVSAQADQQKERLARRTLQELRTGLEEAQRATRRATEASGKALADAIEASSASADGPRAAALRRAAEASATAADTAQHASAQALQRHTERLQSVLATPPALKGSTAAFTAEVAAQVKAVQSASSASGHLAMVRDVLAENAGRPAAPRPAAPGTTPTLLGVPHARMFARTVGSGMAIGTAMSVGVGAAHQLATSGKVDWSSLGDTLTSSHFWRTTGGAVVGGALGALVPGARLAGSIIGSGLGGGLAAPGRTEWGRVAASTAGSLVLASALAPLPGGALVGGVAGAIAGDLLYTGIQRLSRPQTPQLRGASFAAL